MGRVTRDVDPSALRDLLAAPVRATVAFVERDAVCCVPARSQGGPGVFRFAVRADAAPDLADREVVLVVDDGPYWFELRGVSVRGVAIREAHGAASDEPLVWYGLEVRRVLGWDYGTLRRS